MMGHRNDVQLKTGGLDDTKRYHRQSERYDWIEDPRWLSQAYHHIRSVDTAQAVRRHWDGEPILDVGTGTGLILRSLRDWRCVGIDLNEWAVRRARLHNPGHWCLVADAESLPLRAGSFSMALCTEVLEHSPRPSHILSEVVRVLKPGGVLIGSVPSRNPVWKLRRVLSSRRDDLEPAHGDYSRAELRNLLQTMDVLEMRLIAYGMVVLFVARKAIGHGS